MIYIPIILLGFLALADVWTTIRMLRNPNVYEANPFIRWLMGFGSIWIVVKLALTVLMIWVLLSYPSDATIVATWGLVALYGFVVVRNYRLGGSDV